MEQTTVEISVYNKVIILTEYPDHSIIAERYEGDRWFVMYSNNDGTYITQENLEDGGIIDLNTDTNIAAALAHLALAGNGNAYSVGTCFYDNNYTKHTITKLADGFVYHTYNDDGKVRNGIMYQHVFDKLLTKGVMAII